MKPYRIRRDQRLPECETSAWAGKNGIPPARRLETHGHEDVAMNRVAVLLSLRIEDALGIAVLELDRDVGIREYAEEIDEVLRVEADIDGIAFVFGRECFDRFSLIRRGGVQLDLPRLHGQANRAGALGGEETHAAEGVEQFSAL